MTQPKKPRAEALGVKPKDRSSRPGFGPRQRAARTMPAWSSSDPRPAELVPATLSEAEQQAYFATLEMPAPAVKRRVGEHPRRHVPRMHGRLNRAVYGEQWVTMPPALSPRLLLALPRTALVGYLVCCGAADRDGVFAMSKGTLGTALGVSARSGSAVLSLLVDLGLLVLVNSGGRSIASIYRLAAKVDPERVMAVLAQRSRTMMARKNPRLSTGRYRGAGGSSVTAGSSDGDGV